MKGKTKQKPKIKFSLKYNSTPNFSILLKRSILIAVLLFQFNRFVTEQKTKNADPCYTLSLWFYLVINISKKKWCFWSSQFQDLSLCLVYWLLLFGVICYDREGGSIHFWAGDALIDIYRVTNLAESIRAEHTDNKQSQIRVHLNFLVRCSWQFKSFNFEVKSLEKWFAAYYHSFSFAKSVLKDWIGKTLEFSTLQYVQLIKIIMRPT